MAKRAVRTAILCSFNLGLIVQELVRQADARGLKVELYLSGYGQWETDVFNLDSGLYRFAPEVLILYADMGDLLPPLSSSEMLLREDESRRAGMEAWQRIERLLASLRLYLPAQSIILVHTLFPASGAAMGILEGNDGYTYQAAAEIFNSSLRRESSQDRALFVYDQASFVSRYGWSQLYDSRLWHLGRIRLSRQGLALLANDYARYLAALYRPRRKCLVLDLDNTLWGGVVGEDGLARLQIGQQAMGLAYREFQMAALALAQRGIILAVSSKNNPADALEVLENHPDMVLRPQHFACLEISWSPKPEGLKNIARRLNIGLDSLVFWDDNPVEREQVRLQIPEVLVPEIPADVSRWARSLLDLDCFDVLSLTEEDRRRGELYRQQVERDAYLAEVEAGNATATPANYEEFLQSLAIVVSIQPASEMMIPRLSQLTQRTNQFNLTTRRYGEQEVRAMVQDARFKVFGVSVRDRFGDLGLVGVAIVEDDRACWHIDTFLMSCRALGRGIEDALMAFLALEAQGAGAELTGAFVPTAKNAPAREFLERLRLVAQPAGASPQPFRVESKAVSMPNWLQVDRRGSDA